MTEQNITPSVNQQSRLNSFIELTGAHPRLTVSVEGKKGKLVRLGPKGLMVKMQDGRIVNLQSVEDIVNKKFRFIDKTRDRNFFTPQTNRE